MHEWALAEGVIQTAIKVAEEEGIREITEIIVRIGELQQIEHKILEYALEQMRPPMMKDAKLTLENVPGLLRCRACKEEWEFNPESMGEDESEAIHFVPEVAHAYISCPRCGSPDFKVIEGRGVILATIRGLKDDE
ncbi:MAG: hydrogenase nickel incorporation protein HypA [Candidatus Bathyarchaeota archaeon]|jgi:hydrogenase nickel incorporation protein HypA/HybF